MRTGKVLERKQNSVVNFVGTLHFLQDRNNDANRHELTQLVDEIKRSIVDAIPTHINVLPYTNVTYVS